MENLDQYRDKDAFRVPDGYFENLQNNLFQKIHHRQKIARRNKFIISFSSVAACLLIIVGIFSFFHQDGKSVLLSSRDTVSDAAVIEQPLSETTTNPEIITVDKMKLNEKQLANSSSAKSAKKEISENKSQQFDELDYEIVESYSDELVYADILELYSE